jgi:hypothetical protein
MEMDQNFEQIRATDALPGTTLGLGTRLVAVLAVLGGIGFLGAIVVLFGALSNTMTWDSLWSDPVLGVVIRVGGVGGVVALCAALAGLSDPERTDPGVASVAALGALGGGIGALWPVVAMFVLPPASAIVAIYLARVDRLPTSIAMLHAGVALGSIVVGALWAQNASLGLGDLIVLLYPITWIAIGLALLRGLPSSESPASSLAFGR